MVEIGEKGVKNLSWISGREIPLSDLVGLIVFDDFTRDKAIRINSFADVRDKSGTYVSINWTGYAVRAGNYREVINESLRCPVAEPNPDNKIEYPLKIDPRDRGSQTARALVIRTEREMGRAA